MVFQIAEPTLGPEVANLLEGLLGCKIAREGVLQDRTRFDFYLIMQDLRIIVELKIGGAEKLPMAIAQAEEYKEKMNAQGAIVIIYPERARQEATRPEDVRDLAIELNPSAMVLCPFLKNYFSSISLGELAEELKAKLAKPSVAPAVELVVEALRQSVQGISLEIRRNAGIEHPIIRETVGSLALFEILADDGEPSKQKEQQHKEVVADLAAYILINQLLLHQILAKTLNLEKKLKQINYPIELNTYFKEIKDIDYKAVYCIDVASNMPHGAAGEINIAIVALRAIQPENLRHDLLGRIFHSFLPQETRKQLGTFYTRPQAGDILAGLSIDKADEKVMDPACGSGTLLVSAYRRKMSKARVRSHRKLVEEDITGVDIMPFAAHLAALNLTMQSPGEPTNKTRIGIGNSLNLAKGSTIGDVARWLQTFAEGVTGADLDEPMARGEIFTLEPVNTVIMNPPFTRKERVTPEMRGIGAQFFGDQNYWAYFIGLADLMLMKNGKMAAVLPRDFFRGKYSKEVREFLFREKRYNLKYVVKSTKDSAFSESARFRDFLIVLQKGLSSKQCGFIYLKKRLAEISLHEAASIPEIIRQVENGTDYEDDTLFITWKPQEQITESWQDLGQFVVFNTHAGDRIVDFYRKCLARAGKRIVKIKEASFPVQILRGIEPIVENLLDLIYIVRPIDIDRIGHSKLILAAEQKDTIKAALKNHRSNFEIPLSVVKPGLKTAAYVPRIDCGLVCDLAITKSFDGIQEIQNKLGIGQVNFKKLARDTRDKAAHFVVSRRFNFVAPGTKALAFFAEGKVIAGKAFWTMGTDIEQSKILCVWMNSTFAIIEAMLLQTETEGSFIEITKEKLLEFHIPNVKSKGEELLKIFEEVRNDELIALSQQFGNPPEARRKIDKAILEFVGFAEAEIPVLLDAVYKAMDIEMQSWIELMSKVTKAKKDSDLQLHLLPMQ